MDKWHIKEQTKQCQLPCWQICEYRWWSRCLQQERASVEAPWLYLTGTEEPDMWKREQIQTMARGNTNQSNSVMFLHQTCSSILSCLSSAASTASKNSSSLIRLLGPSCENQIMLLQPCKIWKQGFYMFLHCRNILHLYFILLFSIKNPGTDQKKQSDNVSISCSLDRLPI